MYNPFLVRVLSSYNGIHMAEKSKKGNQDEPKKGVASARAWPDLPHKILNLIGRQPTLVHNISAFGGIAKSWRITSRECYPIGKSTWPQLSDNSEVSSEDCPQPCDVSYFFRDGYIWWYNRVPIQYRCIPWKYFVGYSNGLLVAKGLKRLEYFLLDPVSRVCCCLPPWHENIPLKFVALSSSQFNYKNGFVIALTGARFPAFLFCRFPGTRTEDGFQWVRQDSTLVEPFSSNQSNMQFTNAIGFQGKFYVLSLQGSLVVIEDTGDSQLRITGLSKSRAVPTVYSRHFREYLIESGGEILLVFLISRKTFNVVDDVEVFWLHFPRFSWVKMESLGDDRTLFVGANCCISVSASTVECRRNCIYFSQLADENWWVYEMESGQISPGLEQPYVKPTIYRTPDWLK